MWIICDGSQVIIDIASSEVNLSRGYSLAGVPKGDDIQLENANYLKYEITERFDMRIGDRYDGSTITVNLALRKVKEIDGIKRALIESEIRKDKAQSLGFTDIQSEFQEEINELNARKGQLEIV